MVSSNPLDKGTKRSHTVWRAYLKEFANENKLYVKSKDNSNIFRTATEKASVVKNIYELEEKISENDLEFYKKMFLSTVEITNEDNMYLSEIIAFLNNDLEFFAPNQINGINNVLHKELGERVLKHNQEELYTHYEENFLPLYRLLLQKDASFYNDFINDSEKTSSAFVVGTIQTSMFLKIKTFDLIHRIYRQRGQIDSSNQFKQAFKNINSFKESTLEQEFLFYNKTDSPIYSFHIFLISQLFRTTKYNSNIETIEEYLSQYNPNQIINLNIKNVLTLRNHHGIYLICRNLPIRQCKIIFVNAPDNSEFITSDCPIVILDALHKEATLLSNNEIELYYPLSSQLGMLFSNKKCYKDISEFQASPKDVFQFNQAVYNAAHKQVYAKSENSLLDLK